MRRLLQVLVVLQLALMPLLAAPLAPPIQAASTGGPGREIATAAPEGNAVGTGSPTESAIRAASALTATVSVLDGWYSPREITVTVGTAVLWTNNGNDTNTVTSDTDLFDSGDLAPKGGTFSYQFNAPGDYPYHCIYGGQVGGYGMAGIVHVVSASPPPDGADAVIQKTASTSSVNPGDTLEYYLSYGNAVTGTAATNVWLIDTLPVGVQFVSATLTPTSQPAPEIWGGQIGWHWPSLGGNGAPFFDVITVTVQVTNSASGTLHNVAEISMNEPDVNPGNEHASVGVVVAGTPPTPPPQTTAHLDGQMANGYYITPVTATLTVTGGVPPNETYYWLDNWCPTSTPGYPCRYSGPITNIPGGQHTLRFFSQDAIGQIEPFQRITFTVDRFGPQVNVLNPRSPSCSPNQCPPNVIQWYAGHTYAVRWTADDLVSGVPISSSVQLRYSTDGGSTWSAMGPDRVDNTGSFLWNIPSTISTTQAIVQVTAFDRAGHRGQAQSFPFIIKPFDTGDLSMFRQSNVNDVSFTLSFFSKQWAMATVSYWISGTNTAATAYDFPLIPGDLYNPNSRPNSPHWIRVGGSSAIDRLQPLTAYQYAVYLDEDTQPVFTGAVTTGPTLDVRRSDGAWGQVIRSWDGGAQWGGIVYLEIEDPSQVISGTADHPRSAILSAVTDGQGYWWIDLAGTRSADLSASFAYSTTSPVHLIAMGGQRSIAYGESTADPSSWPFNLYLRQTTSRPVPLGFGWNAVGLPLEPTRPISVSQLAETVNGDGVRRLTEAFRYDSSGGWQGVLISGTALIGPDFALVPGEGYFFKMSQRFDWNLVGSEVTRTVPLRLQAAWNLVGVPTPKQSGSWHGFRASTLSDNVGVISGTQTYNIREVDQWRYGTYIGHVTGYSFNDFDIRDTEGYFIRANAAGTLIPGNSEYLPFDG